MSIAERFPEAPGLDPHDEPTPPPVKDHHAEHQRSPKRTTRRWEIGFFIRKIVNGWLVYYKQFPSELPSIRRQEQREDASETETPPRGVANAAAESSGSSRRGAGEGGVDAQDGTGKGAGDGGPVGGSRVEIGFFVSSTTESTESDSDND